MNRPPAISRTLAERLGSVGAAISGSGDAQLVPQARLAGPMPWVIAIMVLLTAIAAAGGLALGNLAARASADLSGGITVQVVSASPQARERQANDVLALLRQSPQVREVRLVPRAEVDALLEPWLGKLSEDPAAANALPVPALIDARLDGPATAERLADLRARLARIAPDARLNAQSSWLEPVFGAIRALRWLSLTLIGLLAATTVAAVLLAARTALNSHRATVEVVHMLGGTDAQIARIFQRSIGFAAAAGAAAGLALAVGAIAVLGGRFASIGAGMPAESALGPADWAVVATVPLVAVILAVVTARITVMRALRQMV